MAIKRDYEPAPKPKKKKPPEGAEGWTHSGLIKDLCEHVNGAQDYVCAEVYAGSRFLERRPVPDALRIRMSYTRPDFAIYEIKVSRADFLSDLRLDKWLTYLPFCSRFYFATPENGVATMDDIPFVAGWMVRGPKGWTTRKTPKVREFEPDFHYALALLISEQKHRWEAEKRADKYKTMKHPENVAWSNKVVERMKRHERELREIASMRRKLLYAKDALKKHFNMDVTRGWIFDDALATKIAEMKQGMSADQAASMRRNLKQLMETLDEIAPQTDGHE